MTTRLAEDPVVRVDEFEGVFSLDRRSHLFRTVVLDGSYERSWFARSVRTWTLGETCSMSAQTSGSSRFWLRSW
jgi:hypothetical protein